MTEENYWKEKYADVHLRLTNRIAELEQENKELKGRCQKLSEDLSCSNGCLRNKIDIEIIYRSALEEIREIAMGIMDDDIDEGSAYYDADQIINKINEVLQCE